MASEKDTFYTLVMTDPDATSRTNPDLREIRHWLVMNIPGCSIGLGDEVIEFMGSGPQKDTGLHRYVFLVYKQPNGRITHNEPRSSSRWADLLTIIAILIYKLRIHPNVFFVLEFVVPECVPIDYKPQLKVSLENTIWEIQNLEIFIKPNTILMSIFSMLCSLIETFDAKGFA